jgi:hypothetical protein
MSNSAEPAGFEPDTRCRTRIRARSRWAQARVSTDHDKARAEGLPGALSPHHGDGIFDDDDPRWSPAVERITARAPLLADEPCVLGGRDRRRRSEWIVELDLSVKRAAETRSSVLASGSRRANCRTRGQSMRASVFLSCCWSLHPPPLLRRPAELATPPADAQHFTINTAGHQGTSAADHRRRHPNGAARAWCSG